MRPRIKHELITERIILTLEAERRLKREAESLLNGECDLITLRRRGPLGMKIRKLRDVESRTVNHR
mgnify:CR=1 FL=1